MSVSRPGTDEHASPTAHRRPAPGAIVGYVVLTLGILVSLLGCQAGEPGVQWTRRWTGESILTGIAWSGSQFVVIAPFGVMTSPDGLTWKAMSWENVPVLGEAGTRPWNYGAHHVMWGGSQFVAVGFTQQTQLAERRALIVTSPDGLTWSRRSSPASVGRVFDVAWSGDRFVAVSGSSILTSPDAVTWSAQRITVDGNVTAVTWGGSQFVAVGAYGPYGQPNGTPLILTSPDGVTWTERTSPDSGQGDPLRDIAWSGDRFVAAGFSTILTSRDGGTWSAQTMPAGGFNAVTWGGDKFVVVGYDISTSPDGIKWPASEVARMVAGGVTGPVVALLQTEEETLMSLKIVNLYVESRYS